MAEEQRTKERAKQVMYKRQGLLEMNTERKEILQRRKRDSRTKKLRQDSELRTRQLQRVTMRWRARWAAMNDVEHVAVKEKTEVYSARYHSRRNAATPYAVFDQPLGREECPMQSIFTREVVI